MSRSSDRRPVATLPWTRDALGVALFPDRVMIARVSGSWRRKLRHKEIVEIPPAAPGSASWQAMIEALAGKVRSGAFEGGNVTLVLSSEFVQYTVVPWSDLLKTEDEQLEYARQRFVRVYGKSAESWSIKVSPAKAGKARLACGMPRTLVEALQAAMSPLGGRFRSLQPYLMTSFNRWRSRLRAQPTWFVVAEPGLLCIALLQDGQWQSVRKLKIDADWPSELPAVLAREECLIDCQTDCDRVLVFAPELPTTVNFENGSWRVENLLPVLPARMDPAVDGSFAIAVGV